MPPDLLQDGPAVGECSCGVGQVDGQVHVHDDGHGAGGQGSLRWHGLRWRYPRSRDKGIMATTDDWLQDRRRMDNAEGLWRVEDNLYDLSSFLDRHPGGREWLELTKGTDVTEVFFTHHVSEVAEALLPKFLVRPAAAPRNSPFTFLRDGFYMQLRERARRALDDAPKEALEAARRRSKAVTDALAVSALLACALAARLQSLPLGVLAGMLLSLTTSAAHNFFHQRPNWRRYYFELSFMSSRDWMISHALSHHIFPNTLQDLEVTFFEPLISFLPYSDKSIAVRYLSWVYSVVLYAAVGHGQFGKRLKGLSLRWSDAVALAVPASMLLAGASLWDAWLMWTWVLVVSSFYFALQGLSAGHHHPDNYHEGDVLGTELDFGLMQLAATASCTGLRGPGEGIGSLLMVLTHFGDHRLHHFFPTVDHAVLPLLEPTLSEHLAAYRLPSRTMTAWEAVRGKYQQMARIKPNQRPPVSLY